ncbi:SET and MYND domain-containing protein 4 isoform X1 [Lates japonicus]|uniref:SET and MYND domain-containing protein 4 isoform X1 n=1 Tax=Lates japonicus TaxID=270547 RepID=A0AAD3M2N5_LATJO|nr:SET and MYND domain-containing protein 4 isoform X1 [Lates japonicus]
MDLPCVQWQDHVAQKWTELDSELKERFTSLREIDDVFKCALTLTTQDDLDFLQSVSAGHSVQKDAEQAAKCRERGNSSFKTRDYTAATLHYSQGICFAPQSSEQLSLCYANRSAALYHLQHYEESLDDIEEALKNGYPSHLLHKLEDRRTQCLKHLSGGQKGKEDHHSPASNNPDTVKVPSVGPLTYGICPQATVDFSPEKGRHLVAVERIAAGEVILTDRPYSCVLIPGMGEVEGKRGNLDAERGVFGIEHSPGLRFLSAVTVATLYLRLSKVGPPPASWALSGPLGRNKQSPDEEGGNADWSMELWLLGSAVLRQFLQLRCNTQAILKVQDTGAENSPVQSSREIRIASAIFPTLSLLNHSCCPNTSLVFSSGITVDPSDFSESVAEDRGTARGVTVTVRAAKGIAAGQDILHCYGPHSSRMVTQERQHLLQEQYYFLCQCEACTRTQEEEEGAEGRWQPSGVGGSQHESGLLCGKCKGPLKRSSVDKGTGFVCSQSSCGHCISSSEVSHRLQEIRVNLEKAVDFMERERPDEALRLLNRAQSQPGLILAETHPLQGELADAMARACATIGDWNNAASHLERSALAITSQYGDDSIELGRQLFKLAQLHFNGGARGPALSVIPKVRRLLCLHCGPHCYELQELQAMEDCLRG